MEEVISLAPTTVMKAEQLICCWILFIYVIRYVLFSQYIFKFPLQQKLSKQSDTYRDLMRKNQAQTRDLLAAFYLQGYPFTLLLRPSYNSAAFKMYDIIIPVVTFLNKVAAFLCLIFSPILAVFGRSIKLRSYLAVKLDRWLTFAFRRKKSEPPEKQRFDMLIYYIICASQLISALLMSIKHKVPLCIQQPISIDTVCHKARSLYIWFLLLVSHEVIRLRQLCYVTYGFILSYLIPRINKIFIGSRSLIQQVEAKSTGVVAEIKP